MEEGDGTPTEGRPERSSDIYPINRFESSNQGSGDRSDTYTHTHTHIHIRALPRSSAGSSVRIPEKAPLRIYIPNAECWSVMFNYRGWYWRVGMCLEEKRGVAAGGRGGEGGIGSGCLFAKSPLSLCGSGQRSDGGARALSNEMASNIVVVVRGICVGRIGRGWQGPPEWHGKLIIRSWKSWSPIEYPKQTAPFAIPRASFRRATPRRDVLLFSDDENRLHFFSRKRQWHRYVGDIYLWDIYLCLKLHNVLKRSNESEDSILH